MIYYDPLFTANQQHWKTLEIPYIAQSTATNYVLLSSKGDFVIDYEISDVKTIPTAHAGGTFDPIAEAEKRSAVNKERALDEQERAEQQSLRDGGRPKLEVIPAPAGKTEGPGSAPKEREKGASAGSAEPTDGPKEELMGNDLSKDPVLI